jgi:hypothetical protein
MKLVYDKETGWGNTLIQISDALYHTLVQKKVPHLPNAVECVANIDVSTDPDEEGYNGQIYINPQTMHRVHPLIRQFVKPTPRIEKLVSENIHGCDVGLHIRRGNYGVDSKKLDDGTPHEDTAWFCDDETLKKFTKVIDDAAEPVFVATDSVFLRDELKSKYGDKVRMYDLKGNGVVHSRACDDVDRTDMYVEWFLLSRCKHVYITAGDKNCAGFSTFGYTAGVYGQSQIYPIFNFD